MRNRSYTQHRRENKAGGGIQLFPFLAVLMCTMGALILLMVILSRQARVQAAQTAGKEMAQRSEEKEQEQKRIRWRIEQLQIAREKTEAQLAEARLELGHLEDHARRLREQMASLKKTLEDLDRSGTADRRQRGALEAELAGLRSKIAEAERQVAAAEAAAAGRRSSYAVVPYEGANQTRRRPLYLECRANAVIVQPEGVILIPEDFEGPMGPGNPLAVALRTEREYLLRQPGYRPERDGEPYPLLLVRPEGIEAYYAARAALHDWGSEFGYELVGADWKLAFPPSDEALGREMRKAVDSAREIHRMRIAAQKREHSSPSRPTYRVAPSRGGVILESGSPEAESPSSGGFAGHRPYIQPGDEDDATGSAGRGSPPPVSNEAFAAGVNNPYIEAEKKAAATAGQGSKVAGQGGVGEGSGFRVQGSGTGNQDSVLGTPNSSSRPGLTSTGGGTAGANSSSQGTGATGGGSGGNLVQSEIAAGAAAGNAPLPNPLPKGEGTAGSNLLAKGEGTSAKGGEPLKLGQWEEAVKPPKDPEERKKLESMAKKRGKDWGLPDKSRDAVPVTRPISVACWPDRLVILSDPWAESGKTIPLGPRTETAMDGFVSALWDQMNGWGIAGRSMYWRPVLKLRVAPGAEERFRDLQNLLEGSGFVVERK